MVSLEWASNFPHRSPSARSQVPLQLWCRARGPVFHILQIVDRVDVKAASVQPRPVPFAIANGPLRTAPRQ